ncbi:MAG: hypothetical protein E6J90_10050 [Deltaproteobacteria bacterium]|nr:MAG: hypothetical protein E6J90_10050 [Deltaproteobacteria bacterium]
MNRRLVRAVHPACSLLSLAAALLTGCAVAAAEPSTSAPPSAPGSTTVTGLPGRRVAVDTPIDWYANPNALVSQTLYLERCRGGCAIHGGANNAQTNTSSIPTKAESTVSEFASSAGLTGAAADAEWNMLATCMREVYSPYAVTVTDVKPTSGLFYHMAVIAGQPGDIGLSPDILGVAPLASDCRAIDNVISFSFANHHAKTADITANILNICWTAAQESAHAYGLDHEYSFLTAFASNGHSACNDPMTYRVDCGGQKFFRNADADCGENTTRPCKCGATQNSHLKILGVFGAGNPITARPSVSITGPLIGTVGTVISAQAGAQRGVAHVELYFNAYKWSDEPGTAFGTRGQLNPDSYALHVPPDLPDSIVDVQAIAYDDLGVKTESAIVTLTKGAACTSASACAKGQKCESGKCFWDPPSGEIGASCSYAQFCKSGLCTGTKDEQICTRLTCQANGAGPGSGVCFFDSVGGGCCSVEGGSTTWWVNLGLAAVALGLVRRRRR